MTAPRRLRAYALTQGRTHAETTLTFDTLLSAKDMSSSSLLGSPEKAEIMRQCYHEPQSPVDLSASLKLPVGTINVLVADLLGSGGLSTGSTAMTAAASMNLDLDSMTPENVSITTPAVPEHRDLTLLEEVLNAIETL